MKKQVVSHDVDLANPPPLTDARQAELTALTARPDSEIDYSDIPPLSEGFWKNVGGWPVLKADQDLDHGARRWRCVGVAQGSGPRATNPASTPFRAVKRFHR